MNYTKEEFKNACKIVADFLEKECPFINGRYDKENANMDFIYGAETIHEIISAYANDENNTYQDILLRDLIMEQQEN